MEDTKTNFLALADLEKCTYAELIEHIIQEYEPTEKEIEHLKNLDILIAYESVGDYGCDSSSWWLLRDKTTKELFEVSGGHCSCYGFEGQWEPGLSSRNYLLSDKFHFSCGGYDDSSDKHRENVINWISTHIE